MIVLAKTIALSNDAGGTELLDGAFKVEVDSKHFDDEIGVVLHGRLVNSKDIAKARRKGTTGFKPSDYRKHGQQLVLDTQIARERFDPSRVHVMSYECTW